MDYASQLLQDTPKTLTTAALLTSVGAGLLYYISMNYAETSHSRVADEEHEPTDYVGLPNLGNTCYLNSLLQALSGCPHYLKYAETIVNRKLIKPDDSTNSKLGSQHTIDILYEFILLLLQLNYHDQDADPGELYRLICKEGEFTHMFEECDTHELNLFMQDKLICLVPKNFRHTLKRGGFKHASSFSNQSEDLHLTNSVFFEIKPVEDAPPLLKDLSAAESKNVQNPLQSLYQTTIECQVCKKHKSHNLAIHRFETHLDFNLDIPSDGHFHTLNDLLKISFLPETVEGYNCIKCSLREYLQRHSKDQDLISKPKEWIIDQNLEEQQQEDIRSALEFFWKIYNTSDVDEEEFIKQFKDFKVLTNNRSTHALKRIKVEITKTKQLLKPPKTLVFHFNRLAYDNTGNIKLNRNFIEFPEHLELDSAEICPFEIDLKYRLCGVIEHIGTPKFGHYIAAKRIQNPLKQHQDKEKADAEWLLCNDKVINPIKLNLVMKSKAYMLFYERI